MRMFNIYTFFKFLSCFSKIIYKIHLFTAIIILLLLFKIVVLNDVKHFFNNIHGNDINKK
jgi:hypothetical protein